MPKSRSSRKVLGATVCIGAVLATMFLVNIAIPIKTYWLIGLGSGEVSVIYTKYMYMPEHQFDVSFARWPSILPHYEWEMPSDPDMPRLAYVTVPLWPLLLLVVAMAGCLWMRVRYANDAVCRWCGYNVSDCEMCSECGKHTS